MAVNFTLRDPNPAMIDSVRPSCRMALNIVEDFDTKFQQSFQHLSIE